MNTTQRCTGERLARAGLCGVLLVRVTHIGLCVSHLETSVRFYRDMLGFEETRRLHFDDPPTSTILSIDKADVDLVYLVRDGLCLELIGHRSSPVAGAGEVRPMDRAGLTHLSILVDDLDALCGRIVEAGGTVLATTATTFASGNRGVMTTDPDGTRLELIEALPR